MAFANDRFLRILSQIAAAGIAAGIVPVIARQTMYVQEPGKSNKWWWWGRAGERWGKQGLAFTNIIKLGTEHLCRIFRVVL